MSQVWESALPPSEKYVLLALADHSRDDGTRIYPSVKTVCRKTGFSRRTVQRHINTLLALEVLAVVKKSVRYGTTEYLIRGDKLTPLTDDNNDIQGRQFGTSGASNSASRGVRVTHNTLKNRPKNHQIEPWTLLDLLRDVKLTKQIEKQFGSKSREQLFSELMRLIDKHLSIDETARQKAREHFFAYSRAEQLYFMHHLIERPHWAPDNRQSAEIVWDFLTFVKKDVSACGPGRS